MNKSIAQSSKDEVLMEECVENILSVIKPSVYDDANRVAAINELKTVIKSISSTVSCDARVNPYGSYISNLHSKWSDLDISVDGLRYGWESLIIVKRALERAGIARKIRFVPQARVPVLSYESKTYDISVDITIDNHVAQIKSIILNKLIDLDSRFRDLVLLVKEWAKMQAINDAKSGTLNSYSLCLLVIFHLQTCDPPILPPLVEIYKGNVSANIGGKKNLDNIHVVDLLVEGILEKCDDTIAKFKSQIGRSKNKSSLSQLLISFFTKFSCMKELARDNIISPYRGEFKKRALFGRLFIEDPFEQAENTARVVGSYELEMIAVAFKKTEDELNLALALPYNYMSFARLLVRPSFYSQLVAQKRNNGDLNISEGEASNRAHCQVEYASIGNLRIE